MNNKQIDILSKEIERLTAESTEWESKCYKYQDIIYECKIYIIDNLKINICAMKCSLSSNSKIEKIKIENEIYYKLLKKLLCIDIFKK